MLKQTTDRTGNLRMMNREEIFIKIRDNTAEVLGIEKTEIEMNSEFKNDLGCDSLMLLDLIMEFEEY